MKSGWEYYKDINGSEVKHAPKTLVSNVQTAEFDSENLQELLDKKVDNVDGVITNAHILDGTIDNAKLGVAAVGTANIRDAAITAAKIGTAAVETAHIKDAAIENAHIKDATIDKAKIKEFAAEVATIAVAKIAQATIQTAQVEDFEAEAAAIAKASITYADVQQLTAHVADIVMGRIGNVRITWADISDLSATIAAIAMAKIENADIGFAQINDLVTNQAIITRGAGSDLYINRLRVTDANMVSLTTGRLIVKGEDGKYYRITIGKDGTVEPVPEQVEGGNIADGTITGENLIEGAISARELNAGQIFADEALMVKLFAGMATFGEIFAASAIMPHIKASVIESDALAIKVLDLSNPIITGSEPDEPVQDMLWLDTSLEPSQLKRWDGTAWAVVNDTEVLKEAAERYEVSITILKDRISQTVTADTYQRDMAGKAELTEVQKLTQSIIDQTAERVDLRFNSAVSQVVEVDDQLQTLMTELKSYINFSAAGISLGQVNSPFKTQISNTRISFMQNSVEVAYISNNKLYIKQVEVTENMKMGGFQMTTGSDGGVTIDWMGVT